MVNKDNVMLRSCDKRLCRHVVIIYDLYITSSCFTIYILVAKNDILLLERGIRFDVPHTVFASHDITHDVFCKIVKFGPINNTFLVQWCIGPHRFDLIY